MDFSFNVYFSVYSIRCVSCCCCCCYSTSNCARVSVPCPSFPVKYASRAVCYYIGFWLLFMWQTNFSTVLFFSFVHDIVFIDACFTSRMPIVNTHASTHTCSEFSKLACFESLVYCQAFVSSSFLWFPFRVCICICICMLDAIFLFYSRYCCFSLEMLIFINAFHLRSWLCMRVEFASIQGKLWIKSVNLNLNPTRWLQIKEIANESFEAPIW